MKNVGFIKRLSEEESSTRAGSIYATCSCGTSEFVKAEVNRSRWSNSYTRYSCDHTCTNCNNKDFVILLSQKSSTIQRYEVLEKSHRGFKIQKTSISVYYLKDNTLKTRVNMTSRYEYDLVDNSIKYFKDDEPITFSGTESYKEKVRGFFKDIDDEEFIDMVSHNDSIHTLLHFALKKLSSNKRYSYYGYSNQRKLYIGLKNLFQHKHLQVLADAGYRNVERFYEPYDSYNSHIDQNETTPAKILKLPKFALNYLKEDTNLTLSHVQYMQDIFKKIEGNKAREIMDIARDEGVLVDFIKSSDAVIELVENYDYTNLKRLCLYLFREIRMYQGIDKVREGSRLLRDYLRMAKDITYTTEKYPKSLKREHDLVMTNYNIHKSEGKKAEFIEAIERGNYKEREFRKKDYVIIAPNELSDLIKEGSELSHCVGSYTNSIIEGRCQIFFLRNPKMIDEPLVTIEVLNGTVRQAKGFANRAVTKNEKEFIKEWAKEKEIQVNYY